MFFKAKQTEVLKVVPRMPVTVPEKAEEQADEEYRAICAKLGLVQDVAVYQREAVYAYLDEKFPGDANGNRGWLWVPLRNQDTLKFWNSEYANGRFYDKPVPYAVLKTVDELTERFPKAKFFISDARGESDYKDPFLLFTLDEGRTQHIVERWNEPAFRS